MFTDTGVRVYRCHSLHPTLLHVVGRLARAGLLFTLGACARANAARGPHMPPSRFLLFRFQLSSGDAKTMRRDAKTVVAWFGTGQIRLLLSSLFYVAFCSENNRRQVKNLLDVALNLTFKGLRSPSFGRVTDV